ncbi:MAG: CRISPR-associated protein Cas5 [Acidobacteriota bacterium]|nr:CRISPR-associated protein Cas5 [Acidobacteriota bacterium]
MKLLHIRLVGWTATFRLPLIYSGTALTAPLPPYSTLLGMIGNMAAREIQPDETRIGFTFQSSGTALDLETSQRLMMLKSGKLKPQSETGIIKRQFHINPILDLYLNNLSFRKYFENARNAPCFGRSQDLAWVTKIKEIEAESCSEGEIRGTLMPFPQDGVSGQILNLPNYFVNNDLGYTRSIGKSSKFVAVRYDNPSFIEAENLVKINGISNDDTIYLRSLG